MRRDDNNTGELPGQDSFLDIVANIVGILILLVMVVGLRAAQTAGQQAEEQAAAAVQQDESPESQPEPPPLSNQPPGDIEDSRITSPASADQQLAADEVTTEQLGVVVRTAMATRNEVIGKLRKVAASREEVALRDAERVHLTTMVASIEQEIDEYRERLSEDQQRDFELRAKLGAAEHELEQLSRERIGLVSREIAQQVEEIESLPTPLASTVSGDELHMRIRNGYVAFVPWDAIREELSTVMDNNLRRFDRVDRLSIDVGPIGGFRAEVQLVKQTVRTREGQFTRVSVAEVTLEPESDTMGEPIAQALQPGSETLTTIALRSQPRKPAITVWVYEDSFNEFRELKRRLFDAGYSVAGRPLTNDTPIGASPAGTKSAAQ